MPGARRSQPPLAVPLIYITQQRSHDGPGMEVHAPPGRPADTPRSDYDEPPSSSQAGLGERRGCLGRLRAALCGGSGDLEATGSNHSFSPDERKRLDAFEGIQHLPPNSQVYRGWLAAQPHGQHWDRWFMMGSIGVCVGVICYVLKTMIELLARVKYVGVRYLIQHTSLGVAWLFNLLYSLALVFVSTWCVVNKAPAAGGAGVAEVMAYLNGVALPKVFNVQTLWVKFVSCVAAVGSGLPVGPEGPLVHIGAMVGAALSQGHSTTLGFSTGLFKHFQNPRDKRDFVTAGTAVGIAAAFSAPIGGLLFAMEELATSSFSQALGWQVFFACMLAVLTVDTFRSAQHAFADGQFGLFDGAAGTVLFEVQTELVNHVAAMAPAALIGLACGLLAIAFTALNLRVARAREALLAGSRRLRMAEPCVIIAVFVTLGMLLPLAFPCTPTSCVMRQGSAQPVCPPGVSSHVRRIVEQTLELYTCSRQGGADTEFPAEGGNVSAPSSYNELATLMSVTGEDAIRHLLSRGTHREFGYAALLAMLAYYFLGAAWAAGSAIASGLFVPMLLIGSCVGRVVGLAAIDIAAARGFGSGDTAPPGVFLPPSPWSWIDPGAFALIGAASFMGGVTRLTISVTVIMMEVSADVRMLLPLLVGILVAKWVADAATHSLYHGLLDVKCIPWLPPQPVTATSLDLLPVSQAMAAPVVTLPEVAPLSELRRVLRETRHNGVPVVRPTPSGKVFVGLVSRDHLLVLLRKVCSRPPDAPTPLLPYQELNQQYVSAAARSLISQQQELALQERGHQGNGAGALEDGAREGSSVDLRPYVDASAVAVPEAFSLERAYHIFCTLGLRHLTVVDEGNHVKGILTRKDLLGYKLDEALLKTEIFQQRGSFS